MKKRFSLLAALSMCLSAHAVCLAGGGPWIPSYDFNTDDEGWTTGGANGVFDFPFFGQLEGTIGMTAANNTNCFGFYESTSESPITDFSQEDELKERGIFFVRHTTRVDATAKANVPTFRYRFTSLDFSKAAVTAIESVGDLSYIPDPPQEFRGGGGGFQPAKFHYTLLEVPSNEGEITGRFSFDILNFGGLNDPMGAVYLDQIDFQTIFQQDLVQVDQETFDLTSDDRLLWSFSSPPGLIDPVSASNTNGLTLAAAPGNIDPPGAVFGSWESTSALDLVPGVILCIEWTLETSASAQSALSVPTIRLRGNGESFQSGWYLNLESTDPDLMPTGAATKSFRSYFATGDGPEEPVKLAFDYLWVPGDGNDPSIAVTLKECTVTRFGGN